MQDAVFLTNRIVVQQSDVTLGFVQSPHICITTNERSKLLSPSNFWCRSTLQVNLFIPVMRKSFKIDWPWKVQRCVCCKNHVRIRVAAVIDCTTPQGLLNITHLFQVQVIHVMAAQPVNWMQEITVWNKCLHTVGCALISCRWPGVLRSLVLFCFLWSFTVILTDVHVWNFVCDI